MNRAVPAGVILGGGLARRMGGADKGLLTLGGRSLAACVATRLRPQVTSLAINANGDPSRFARFGMPVLPDSLSGYLGPLAGILAGLDWAAEAGHPALVSVAVDTPFFPTDLVERLQAAAGLSGLALAASKLQGRLGSQRHPTFGLWPVSLRDDLRDALLSGTRKVTDWADAHTAGTAMFDGTPDPFFNINTPEDLALAESWAATR